MIDDQVFYIMEYARRDKLGRQHSWRFGGIAQSLEDVEQRTQQLKKEFDCEVRAHRYSHAFGNAA